MTEYRASVIQYNLEKLKQHCLSNDEHHIHIQLIDYMQEIIEALPKTK